MTGMVAHAHAVVVTGTGRRTWGQHPGLGQLQRQVRQVSLTPAQRAELEQVSVDVDIVDAPQEKVEVEAFDGHPGEAAEQCIV